MPGSVSHAKRHDILSRDHTGTFKKTRTFWISDEFGDDTTGDGSIMKPFKTVQYAMDLAFGSYAASVDIVCDQSIVGADIWIPANKQVYVEGLAGPESNPTFNLVTLNKGSSFFGNSVRVADFAELGVSLPARNVFMEEGYISNTFTMPNTYMRLYGTRMTYAYFIASTCKGTKPTGFVMMDLGAFTMCGNLDMHNGFIYNLNDPIFAQEGATKNYVDSNIVLAGATPVDADMTGYATGRKAVGTGTGGRVFLMYNTGTDLAPVVKYVELS
jgi:hypothetical protein